MSLGGLLRDRVSIERMTPTKSATGEVPGVWAVIATNVPALIQARSGHIRQGEYGKADPSLFRGFLGVGTNIRLADRIVFGNVRYLVTFLANRHGHHLEVDLSSQVSDSAVPVAGPFSDSSSPIARTESVVASGGAVSGGSGEVTLNG
jgi:hypothetical protein